MTHSHFLSLPAELRNAIYVFVFPTHDHLKRLNDAEAEQRDVLDVSGPRAFRCAGRDLALLLVCRQVYSEAHVLAFSLTKFLVLHESAETTRQALIFAKFPTEKLSCIKSLTKIVHTPFFYSEELLLSIVQMALIPELNSLEEATLFCSRPQSCRLHPSRGYTFFKSDYYEKWFAKYALAPKGDFRVTARVFKDAEDKIGRRVGRGRPMTRQEHCVEWSVTWKEPTESGERERKLTIRLIERMRYDAE
ncbi:uncharacterized protein BDR25DRAFT_300596 [Lindgomyces ingoldianus]|uniref:Uncharacterized protein n=1 Tax=Lindgomyces ingoldianus TaxID=673940 RepID=A0ACB6RD91_9PLEO|nr:uncharacterized protein BDR25DRAFT_300596 [Lindgomyces ingoldianus]KAF2476723.1 hypothetical protein BDR25DRAFT_300596 [Lindgomyces ingoldianus]